MTYEDQLSMALKAAYFIHKKQAHIFFWELSSDTQETQTVTINGNIYQVPKAGELLTAVHNAMVDFTFYEKYENVTTFVKTKYTEEELENLEQTLLEKNIDITYNKIINFKLNSKFKILKNNIDKIDTYNLDITIINSKINDAKTKYTNEKNNLLKIELESILKDINEEFEKLQREYKIKLLRIISNLNKEKEFKSLLTKINADKSTSLLPYEFKNLKDNINNFLDNDLFKTIDINESTRTVIQDQKIRINTFYSSLKENITVKINNKYPNIKSETPILFNEENLNLAKQKLNNLRSFKTFLSNEDIKALSQFSLLKQNIIDLISTAKNYNNDERDDIREEEKKTDNEQDEDKNSNNDNPILNNDPTNLLQYFDQKISKVGWGRISIILTVKDNYIINFKNAKIYLQGLEQYSPTIEISEIDWLTRTVTHQIENDKIITKITFTTDSENINTTFGKINDSQIKLTFSHSNAVNANSTLGDKINNIKVIRVIGGKNKIEAESEDESKPQRENPVKLKVKGWPSTLAMGTITDNKLNLNNKFKDSKIDSIFKYAGDGFGDRGNVIEPIPTMEAIAQAREIEALDGEGKTKIMPTIVVYTANGNGGGLAPHDIKTNYSIENNEINSNNRVLENSNIVKHFRNLIRMAVQMQSNVDINHPNPATVILNADIFGEWQKNKLNGGFQNEYCGGFSDINCDSLKPIQIREAMIKAIELEENYAVTKYDINGVEKNGIKLSNVGVLKNILGTNNLLHTNPLSQIKAKIISSLISNDIKGWVQSQNFILKEFSPDVPFGWVINLSNPGNAYWIHNQYAGERKLWESASKSVAIFIKWIGAYDNDADESTVYAYKPDFLVFDKYERDGLGASGKSNYAFSSRAWDNYLMYVKQITDFIDIPAMLWQIPGGHMVAKNENLSGASKLCENDNEEDGCFRHLDTDTHEGHSATGGTYFMGDKNIGSNPKDTIKEDVLNISISGIQYNGATNLRTLLEQTDHDLGFDWGKSKLRHAAFSNVFAILWGGRETTGSVPISTNKTGGHNWLKNKIVNYQTNGKIPLYNVEKSENSNNGITSIESFNTELINLQSKMNNNVLLFNTGTGWTSSTIYKWEDFLDALKATHNTGVNGDKFWLFDDTDAQNQKSKYAKVAIASFLAQSMQETIQYDACDENSWQFLKDATSEHQNVLDSYNNNDFIIDLPMDAACGQLGQVYSDYGMDSNGIDNPYSCPRTPKMEVTAVTNATYYGAAGPIFSAPDSVLDDLGLLINGKAGHWDYAGHCQGIPATDDNFTNPTKEGWLREECKIYKNQKAGSYIWDGSSQRSLEGCSWWGRGVIQTTGRENFGKLNHFIGRSHIEKDIIGKKVSWAGGKVEVKVAPVNPLYADMDLCSNPQLICSSTQHPEIKWIAGLFFWMNSVQAYDIDVGKYSGWDYTTELKKYVDSNFGQNNYKPENGINFIDSVSGIVNRGCPDVSCPKSGLVHGKKDRKNNFEKVMKAFGVNDIN